MIGKSRSPPGGFVLNRMPGVVLLLETGMRRGELLGLHTDDIDRRRKLYRVSRSIVWVNGQAEERAPKCLQLSCVSAFGSRAAGCRRLAAEVYREISHFRRYRAAAGFMEPKTKVRNGKACTNLSGMPEITAHEIRHTYGTYLRRHGTDIYSISKILGHRDINVTARIYVSITNSRSYEKLCAGVTAESL